MTLQTNLLLLRHMVDSLESDWFQSTILQFGFLDSERHRIAIGDEFTTEYVT
jgi:hypothetical protein